MIDSNATSPAVLVGQIKVHDPTLWQRYVDGVSLSLQAFAAEILFRGQNGGALAGDNSFQQVVVIRFQSLAELQSWYHSEDYQQLIPIRDQAADVQINYFEL